MVVSLIHEAGQPYYDWFFAGPRDARAAVESWLARPSSELSASRVSLVYSGRSRPDGVFIGLDGADLRACRSSDLLALVRRTADAMEREALVERIAQTRDLFAPVEDDEYHLSKIGVAPDRRGVGVGRAVLGEFLAAGEACGYRRFSLDVSAGNTPALRLYASAGFKQRELRERMGMRYLRMVRERLVLALLPACQALETVLVA